ncbi:MULTISPECIES: di-heme oxidoredictase family protein [Sphingobacterium]|uniref:di-heme oxidoredictase family protein n=1 Tax=Sphingobacterium TaxID=28453 RepID=UPI0008A5E644|nr:MULTISPECIES: di-heme oxidoredictase family protein [Sphingobacterium]MBB1642694.1 thiol oxidoreductase [Sphingobacterium sp. UME9]OFV09558.1 thiol oxidoreductase [Sphingobacterium sp. HMSC13C05]HAL53829.1 thiol oxidoreductase [Sphingobacterium sp.]
MKKTYIVLLGIITLLIGIQSCEKLEPGAPPEDELLDGPIEGLNYEERQRFLNGDATFNDEVFTVEKGLGPLFVSNSCVSCHSGDGKGHPFSTLTRFGQTDETGNKFLHHGGPQLQNRAIPGYLPETIPAGATFSKFTPPAVTGLGLLESVPDDLLLAMADPEDADGDGISGRVNWINLPSFVTPRSNAVSLDGKYIGRFGKKGSVYNLLQQTVDAFAQDMGIATVYNPVDVYSGDEIDPEIETQRVNDLAFYLKTLKAPIQRNQNDPDVVYGKSIFTSLKCTSCHKPQLTTGDSPISALAFKEFSPYTDLLLHDMGPGLDDGYTEGTARTYEWRTPPLWGLGLSAQSQGGKFYLLHDGRAKSIEEAIEMHGGEASQARQRYRNLSQNDQAALIKFLKSL